MATKGRRRNTRKKNLYTARFTHRFSLSNRIFFRTAFFSFFFSLFTHKRRRKVFKNRDEFIWENNFTSASHAMGAFIFVSKHNSDISFRQITQTAQEFPKWIFLRLAAPEFSEKPRHIRSPPPSRYFAKTEQNSQQRSIMNCVTLFRDQIFLSVALLRIFSAYVRVRVQLLSKYSLVVTFASDLELRSFEGR